MKQHIALIALEVEVYDEAIEFYRKKLEFMLVEDILLSSTKRWIIEFSDKNKVFKDFLFILTSLCIALTTAYLVFACC